MAENLASIFIQVHRRSRAMCNSGIFTASPVTTIDLQAKYTAQTAKIKERFDSLRVTYKGTPQSGGLISKDTSTPTGSYFYHSDHLGSSSLITDASGAIVQHLEYVPFGETFIDERRSQSSWTTPYLFSGKERDEETGLLYFGARYQDSKYGIWYSVDPLGEKYPNISSYVYCADNPVIYIDPDGRQTVSFGTFVRVNPFIPKSQFIGWGYPGVKENCFDYAWKQLRVVGYTIKSPSWWEYGKKSSSIYQLFLEKNVAGMKSGVQKEQFEKGVQYLKHSIENGIPVLVGADDAKGGNKKSDKTTNHFFVIDGMGHDKKGNYFLFKDNATGDPDLGSSENNRLYVNEKEMKLSGTGDNSYVLNSEYGKYTVTQIRESKKEKK